MSQQITLVLGAVAWETAPIEQALSQAHTSRVDGVACTRGVLSGMPIAVALTGVGKTNTGLVLGLLYNELKPKRVLFCGSGARVKPEIEPGTVVLAQEAFFHDAGDLREDGMHPLPVFGPGPGALTEPVFRPDPRLLDAALQAAQAYHAPEPICVDGQSYPARVQVGRIATGDLFSVNQWKLDELRGRFDADVLEMEGASVGQACQTLGVPWLLIRGGSDLVQAGNATADYLKYGPIAARQAALFTRHLIERLAAAELRADS